jgi:S-layer homology domain
VTRFAGHAATRSLIAIFCAALAMPIGSFASPAPVSAGGCDLKASIWPDGAQTDGVLQVREWEDFIVWGFGLPASTPTDLVFHAPDDSTFTFEDVPVDAAGEFAEIFFFERGNAGPNGWWVGAETCIDDSVDFHILPANHFVDVATHPFDRDIAWLFRTGITTGCSADRFCPEAPVTREQMASFLARAFGLADATLDYFTDDNGSIHEADINRMALAQLTTGCGGGRYCPGAAVSRQEMASFLARAFGLPDATLDYFTDDSGSIHEADINRMALAQLTSGCGGTAYCPTNSITRGQMAAFLFRAIYLLGYTYVGTTGGGSTLAPASVNDQPRSVD